VCILFTMASITVQESTLIAGVMEFITVMESELCMFALAGLVYLLIWSGAAASIGLSKPKKVKTPPSNKENAAPMNRPKAVVTRKERPAAVPTLDVSKCARVIREHGKAGKLEAALAEFGELKNAGACMTSVAYNSIIDACVQCNDMRATLEYFAEAKQNKLADVVSYNIAVKGHLAANDTASAQALLAEMKEHGLEASHATYHSLLQSSVQTNNQSGAWQYVAQMHEANLKPTPVTCSMLLKLVNGPSDRSFLKRVLSLTDNMDLPVDEVFLVALVEACLRSHRLDVLAARLDEYRRKDVVYQLSAATYGSMIKAYGQAWDVKQVWALWGEMERCKVQPSAITLGCMVDALVMNGAVEDAWVLVEGLWKDADKKQLLNTVIYSTIVKGFAMSRRLDRALAVYDEMRGHEIQCNTITYNTILNALVRCGDLKRLPELLKDMQNSSPQVEPDMITYSTIMKGYCSAGDLDKGLDLLRDMEKNGEFTPDEVMFNSLLDGCAKERRLDDALTLLDKMRKGGVPPSNYTLSIMVKLLGRSKRLARAFAMVKEVTSEFKFRPNIQVYTCLMQACFHNRELNKALALHDEIIAEGCHFDCKAYVSLVRGCLQANAAEKAADVVRCAFGLPGTRLRRPEGRAPGVEQWCVDEVLAKLSRPLAHQLSADLAAPKPAPAKKSTAKAAPWRKPDSGDNSTDAGSSGPSDESSSGESESEFVLAK